MAKGLERHQERQRLLSGLGKELTRRSGAKCELCEASGVALRVIEVPPQPETPILEQSAFACDTCSGQLENPRTIDPDHWRCAVRAVWSEVPAVQVLAARVLDRLSKGEAWAREALDEAYFEAEVEVWISQCSL